MPNPSPLNLSVIMPAYNEEAGLAQAVAEVQRFVLDTVPGSELLVVNDGSKDGTGALADQLAATDPRVHVIHKPNGGHGSAVMTGLDASTAQFVLLIDSDRQIPLDGVAALWASSQSLDGVFGQRRQRADASVRIALTRVIRIVNRVLFGVWIVDSNVPYKLVRRERWTQSKPVIPPGTLAPSMFLALWMLRHKLNVKIVTVEHLPRTAGEVSIRRWKLFKFCWRAFRQLVRFRFALMSDKGPGGG